jgi:hypothetical protein
MTDPLAAGKQFVVRVEMAILTRGLSPDRDNNRSGAPKLTAES